MFLWGAFVVLDVVSLLWGISLLGLQPLVVSLSYAAGGFMAFQGVRAIPGICVAEVATAGAIYGAVGSLTIGNASVKVRPSFFRKGQVPFVFIIAGLLVVDAVLNSRIANAEGSVILKAVVFPFVFAGVATGLIWSVLNRLKIRRRPARTAVAAMPVKSIKAPEQSYKNAAGVAKLMIPMPENEIALEEDEPLAPAVTNPYPDELPAESTAAGPMVAEETAGSKVHPVEEAFFPLEIDKGDAREIPADDSSLLDMAAIFEEHAAGAEPLNEDFELPPLGSGMPGLDDDGGTIIDELAGSDADASVRNFSEKTVDATPESPQTRNQGGEDWLSGHRDLLNRLK
jgi:hypothetical protein